MVFNLTDKNNNKYNQKNNNSIEKYLELVYQKIQFKFCKIK